MKLNFIIVLLFTLLSSCSMMVPIDATSNPVGSKKGVACAEYLFGVIPLTNDDNSIHKAAKNGGISKISTVDTKNLLTFFYNRHCTIVRGH